MTDIYVSPGQMFEDSFALAKKLYDDNVIPDIILTIWRGGAIPGLCIGEYYKSKGIETKDIVIKACSYSDDHQKNKCKLMFYDNLREINKTDRVLIVDDIFDTGETFCKVIEAVYQYTTHVKTSAVWYKPDKRNVIHKPDYFIHKVSGDPWVTFPHETT